MKVLVVGPRSPDHLVSCVWDGLQEILGEGNVVDAVDSPWLHSGSLAALKAKHGADREFSFPMILQGISGVREGARLESGKGDFDVMVLASSFNRDHDWGWARSWLPWLRPNGKVAYLEGWDAAWQVVAPEIPVDAVFRKEISAGVHYPYLPHHLTFAAPARWIHPPPDQDRPYDVVFVGNPNSVHPSLPELRWRMLAQAFSTKRHHSSVLATRGVSYDSYFRLLRASKLALCPTAADSSDSLRTYEAAACGAIPIFVGYPCFNREPWFGGDCSISCTVETLPEHIDNALSHDLTPMRERLREHALANHTTKARAIKLLGVLGFHEGADF